MLNFRIPIENVLNKNENNNHYIGLVRNRRRLTKLGKSIAEMLLYWKRKLMSVFALSFFKHRTH